MKTQMKISGLILGALLFLSLADSVARADTADSAWQISVPAYLSAGAYHLTHGNGSHSFSSVNATAEILVSSPLRPVSAALFVDYNHSPDEQYNGILSIGAYADYEANRWDITGALFNHDGPKYPDEWAYAGRFRYRVAGNHKIGVEILGALRDASSPNLGVGYYGDISDTLSIKIVAGGNFKSWTQRAARTELVWQFN